MTRKPRQLANADPTTRGLAKAGVLRVEVTGHGRSREKVRVPYSFSAAVKSITILSFLLWWLPTFGQMIAGYVGGRRAGAPWKAALAACVPVLVIYGTAFAAENGYFTNELAMLSAIPAMAADYLSSAIPALTPYIDFVSEYLATFIGFLKATVVVGLDGYMVTIIFAYVGGVVAQQRYRELRFGGYGATTRTVVSAPLHRGAPVRSTGWSAVGAQHLGDMKKIPVVMGASTAAKAAPVKKRRKVNKPAPAAEEVKAAEAVPRATRYDRKAVNRRLVERALSHYKRERR